MRGMTKRIMFQKIVLTFAECLDNHCSSPWVEVRCDYFSFSTLVVFSCLRLPETGELLLLLLAAILSEQQLWLEGGRSRSPVCVVWRGRDHRWVAVWIRFERIILSTAIILKIFMIFHFCDLYDLKNVLFLHIVFISGGTVQGLISDFLGKRAPVLCVSLLLAMGALVGYSRECRLHNTHP